MSEKNNSPIHLRPRFTIDLEQGKDVIINRFKNAHKENSDKFLCRFVDAHIFIDVPPKKAHFWSPQLQIEIESLGDKKSLLKGLFGPKPQVWTLFMFLHFVVGMAFFIFGIMLYARLSLDKSIIFPLMMMIFLPLLWLLLYFLGRIGKSTGHLQMDALHDFMIKVIKN